MGTEIFEKYEKVIMGGQFAIGLYKRGDDDKHVCVDIVHEDDGNWFLSENGFSSYWLPELQKLLEEAADWMKKNCLEDKVGRNIWGYKFSK